MQFVQNYSIMHLSYLFNDENNAFNFAVQKNMIYNILNCNDCGIQLKIYKDKYKKFSYYFKCTKCKRVYSILYQSIWYSPTKTHFLIRMHSKSQRSIQTQLTF